MDELRMDWRWYLGVFRRWWWVMLLPALPAAILAYALTAAQLPIYRATARLTIVPPAYLLNFTNYQFATNVDPVFDSRDYTAVANQALSERVLERLAESEAGQTLPAAEREADALRKRLATRLGGERAGSDPALVSLTVTDTDPQRAADLANAWAAIFAEEATASTIFGAASEINLAKPAAEARDELEAADSALRDFEAASPIPALTEGLTLAVKDREAYLEAARTLGLIQQEDPAATAGPVTVQLGATTLNLTIPTGADEGTRAARQAFLADWIARFTAAAADLEPTIADLQTQLADAQREEANLQRARDAALTYSSLLDTKVRETSLQTALGETQIVRPRSEAVLPRKPVATRSVLNAELAGAVGLGLGVLLAFAVALLQRPKLTGTTA